MINLVILILVPALAAGPSEATVDRGYGSKGFRVGFMSPVSRSMGEVDRLMAVDLVYQYDAGYGFVSARSGVRAGGGLNFDGTDAMDFAILDLKAGKYFSRQALSPFVSAGAGIHWVRIRQTSMDEDRIFDYSDDGAGICLTAGTGFTAMRTSSFQLQLELDYFIVLEKIGSENVTKEYPRGILFTLCLKKGGR